MKLTDVISQIRKDNKIEVKKTKDAEKSAPTSLEVTDKVELSASSKEVQKMRNIIRDTPSVRAEKVETLKRQIENGEYKVDGHSVADKMIESLMADQGLLG